MIRYFMPIAVLGAFATCASQATAQERCLAGQYHLPASIADQMRPYLLCGLIHERADTATMVNGVPVLMHGERLASCANERARALAAADKHLAATMHDEGMRQAFLQTEFKKADGFLQTAAKSDDVGIGQQPNAGPCRSTGTMISNGANK